MDHVRPVTLLPVARARPIAYDLPADRWSPEHMAPPEIDFWFDFASTYSYPASQRIGTLAHAAGVAVRFRPFLLGPLFKAQGWTTSPFNIYPARGRYMWRDLERICTGLGLAFTRPEPFPQNSLLAARVAIAAADQPWMADYCVGVFRAAFAHGRDIADPAVIQSIVVHYGGDADLLLQRTQGPEIKARLREETETAVRLGIFGAPSFVTADGELFWGNDRLEVALAWARRPDGAAGSAQPAP